MKTGEYIVINTDPSYDTYLFAESGKSRIQITMDGANSGTLTGSWRQYGL